LTRWLEGFYVGKVVCCHVSGNDPIMRYSSSHRDYYGVDNTE